MKRKRPDNRLDWRDPNMPVLQGEQRVDNWTGKIVEIRTRELTAQQANYNAQCRMMMADLRPQDSPSWQDDPTYNMKRKRK